MTTGRINQVTFWSGLRSPPLTWSQYGENETSHGRRPKPDPKSSALVSDKTLRIPGYGNGPSARRVFVPKKVSKLKDQTLARIESNAKRGPISLSLL
jgi:hypothetical protein